MEDGCFINRHRLSQNSGSSLKTCTQEAKICSDGSSVERVGPNCEFTECFSGEVDETVNWKTYIDVKYGFSFKYPNTNWVTEELPNPITGEYVQLNASCKIDENKCSERENIYSFDVIMLPYKSFAEYLASSTPKILDYEEFQFNGLQAIKAANPGTCTVTHSDQCQFPMYEIFVIKNKQAFLISESFRDVTYANKLNQFPKPNPNILATFKFTNGTSSDDLLSKPCAQVITPAKNLQTGQCQTFTSSCIPEGWIVDRINCKIDL